VDWGLRQGFSPKYYPSEARCGDFGENPEGLTLPTPRHDLSLLSFYFLVKIAVSKLCFYPTSMI